MKNIEAYTERFFQQEPFLVTGNFTMKERRRFEKSGNNYLSIDPSMVKGDLDLSGLPGISVERFSFGFYYKKNDSELELVRDVRWFVLHGLGISPIDISKYLKLVVARVNWRKALETLLNCPRLRYFESFYFNEKSFPSLKTCPVINEVVLSGYAGVDLQSNAGSKSLKVLDLRANRNLRSLDGIEEFQELTSLRIDGANKLEDISSIKSLRHLRVLELSGCKSVSTLKPLAQMNSLEGVAIGKGTRIQDGDLSPLKDLSPQTRIIVLPSKDHNLTFDEPVVWSDVKQSIPLPYYLELDRLDRQSELNSEEKD